MKTLYILACAKVSEGGGIFRVRFEGDRLIPDGYYPCDRPMYAVMGGDGRLHVVLRAPFAESDRSGSFSLSADLTEATDPVDTLGVCGCHLAVDGGDTYVVNYLSGNVSKNGKTVIAHEGRGAHPTRQEGPHTHCAILSPDRASVLVTDLGTDEIYVYDRDLNERTRVKNPAGYGIRHIVFSQDGKYLYAANELIPSVSVFRFAGNALTYLSTLECPCLRADASGAAIRLSEDGSQLFYSVRGENKVFVLDAEGASLRIAKILDAGGDFPRDLVEVDRDHLLTCNEKTHDAVLLRRSDGARMASYPARGALCAVVVDR